MVVIHVKKGDVEKGGDQWLFECTTAQPNEEVIAQLVIISKGICSFAL